MRYSYRSKTPDPQVQTEKKAISGMPSFQQTFCRASNYLLNQQISQLPQILSFGSSRDKSRAKTSRSNSLKIISTDRLDKQQFNRSINELEWWHLSQHFVEHFRNDWNDFYFLVLNLRIQDAHHNNHFNEQFNDKLIIGPGQNNIIVKIQNLKSDLVSRDLYLQSIRKIIIFAQASTLTTVIKFALDNITLTK